MKRMVDNFAAEVQPSSVELQKIQARSQEIYDQLQARRTELGLGDFDNTTPPVVKKMIDKIEYMQTHFK